MVKITTKKIMMIK